MKTKSMSLSESALSVLNTGLLVLIAIIILYPLIYVTSSSFSDPYKVMRNEVWLWPLGFNLHGYEKVFTNPDIWRSYLNTIEYTVVGTTFSVFMTLLAAYPLSRKDLFGKNAIMILITFTMFFGGGLIPSYLLINKLHMVNTFWVMVIPGGAAAWYVIIARTFFQQNIPYELQEAAFMDGANDITILIKIVFPLSLPLIAILVLFYGVIYWNSFFDAMIYLQDRKKFPLQLILREILVQNISPTNVTGSEGKKEVIGESIRYALIIVATVPILLVYPFIQKYFVKGMLVGSIKG